MAMILSDSEASERKQGANIQVKSKNAKHLFNLGENSIQKCEAFSFAKQIKVQPSQPLTHHEKLILQSKICPSGEELSKNDTGSNYLEPHL